MTVIAFQDGKVIFRGEKVGAGQDCCCGADVCVCPENCPNKTLTISVTYCGITASLEIEVPGSGQVNVVDGDDFVNISAAISCQTDPCGWFVDALICYACGGFANGEGFTALIEPDESGCPESGAVPLICFGEQFGFPCATSPTAQIS